MNDFVNRLASFNDPLASPAADPKQMELARTAALKKAELGGPESLSVPEVLQAYEDPGAVFQNRAADASLDRAQRYAYRTDAEALLDTGRSIHDGFVSGVTGLGALGIGIFSDRAGAWASQKSGEISDWYRSGQSGALNARRQTFSRDNAADAAKNTETFNDERRTQGDFVAGLRRIGRDAVSAVGNAVNDPAILSDGIANGLGSMALGGPLSKGLSAVGQAALKGATYAAPSLLFSERAARIAALGSKASMPASIGLTEAGGTYQQTFQESMDRLQYRKDLTEDQKFEMANDAAKQAAAIQLPVAAATGILTAGFEKSPLRFVNGRNMAGNLIKETVEEGIQSATSQLATNRAIQSQIDPTKELSEGVGEQLGLGALYGLGTAGAVQTPGAVLNGAVKGAKLATRATIKGVNAALGSIQTRADQVDAQIKATSPVAAPVMDQVYATAIETAPAIQAATVEAIQNATDVTPEQKAATVDYVDQFFNDVKFNPQEITSLPIPMADILIDSTDRFDAIKRAAEAAVNPEIDPETRLMSALYLEGQVTKYAPNLQETIERIPDEHPALDQLRAFEDVLINLGQDPRVAQAVQIARNFADNFQSDAISDQNIETRQGQNAAQNVASAVSVDPTRVAPEVVDTVLKHATSGKIQLTPQQRTFLETAANLNRIEQEYMDAGGKLGLTNSEIVTREIQTDKGNKNSKGLSAAEHLKGVFEAVRMNKPAIARERMAELTNFTQSLQNKIRALNESLESGEGAQVNYEAYNPKTKKFFKAQTPVFLNGRSENSVQAAQNMALDAKAVADVQSSLARAFPDLGFASVEQYFLDADIMNQPADQAARQYREKIQRQKAEARRQANNDRLSSDTRAQGRPDNSDRQTSDRDSIASEQATTNEAQNQQQPVTQFQPSPENAPAVREESRPQVSEPQPSTAPESQPVPEPQAAQEEGAPAVVDQTSTAVEDQVTANNPEESVQETEAAPVAPDADTTFGVESVSTPSTDVTSIDVAYPDLLGSPEGRGRNLFKQAYTLPAEAISRLTQLPNPIQMVREALTSGTKFREFVGQKAGDTKLTDEVASVYGKLIAQSRGVYSAMNEQLKAAVAKNAKFIQSTPDWYTRNEYRALAIAENNDGVLSYNNELQQNAILAGLQWMLQAEQRQRYMDDEDVAKIIGFEPTPDQTNLFNQGIYYDGAVIDLTDTISRFWGLRTNPNTGQGFTRGVPEGVGKEVIRAMEAAGFLNVNRFKIGNKEYRQIDFNLKDEYTTDENGNRVISKKGMFTNSEFRILNSNPSMIEMVSMIEPEQVLFVGAPPSKTPTNQLRNPDVKLTPQQTAMVEKEQSVPFYVVPHMLSFVRELGVENVVALFGHGNLENLPMNKSHKTSLTSVNRALYAAYDAIDAMADRAEQVANETKTTADAVPIYYAYEFTSVNRLQMLGKHNPQANKLAREIIMPTRSTVDMTDPSNQSMFWLAVGQAWGDKVHKMSRQEAVLNAQALALGSYNPVIEMLQGWLNQNTEIGADQIAEIRKVFGDKPVAPVAFYAAMEVARLRNADEAGRKAFTTSLYVEADGITDGPMNAMVHMTAGDFTPTWVETMRKGGLYFDKRGATSNDQGNIADLYQVTADAFKNALAKLQRNVDENGPVRDSLAALIRLSGSLLGDLSYDPATNRLLNINRGAVKNPLTVVIYGAGDRGIANKISTTLVKAIYERMSQELQFAADNPNATKAMIAQHVYPQMSLDDALKSYNQYEQDVTRLMMNRVQTAEGGLRYFDMRDKTKTPDIRRTNEEFEFTADMQENLQENVLSMFVQPLQEGIQANIGETIPGTTMLRQVTEIQSIYLQAAYERAIEAALDKRAELAKTDGSGWIRSDFLSQKELRVVADQLKYLSPLIQTGTQNMLISGSERVPVKQYNERNVMGFSRSLDGQNHTGAYTNGFARAGVSGIPKLTISTGDGQMMQNFSTDPEVSDGYMLIFDGGNFRLEDVENYSQKINKAVYNGWMGNPMMAVSKTFDDFIRLVDLNAVTDEKMNEALTYAITGKRNQMKVSDIVSEIKALQKNLQAHALDTQARKNVLARVQMSVDHMASAGAPFVSGENLVSLEGLTTDQAVARLNQLLMEERSKLTAKKGFTASLSTDTLNVVSGTGLRNLVRQSTLPVGQKQLLAQAVRNAEQLGYRLVTGSQEAIDNYANENGLKKVAGNPGEQVKGYTVPQDRTIYMVEPSEETMLHELIHAATIEQVSAYYNDQSSLSEPEVQAISRIEGLMDEWLRNQDAFSTLNAETRQAATNARNAILGASDPAVKLNEFMAWVLANQNLNQVASLTKVQNPVIRIVKDVLQALKNLFGIKMKVGDDLLSNLRFNTQVLMAASNTPSQALADTILFQSGEFGNNDRLSQLGQTFVDKIAKRIQAATNPAERLTENLKATEAAIVADRVTTSVMANGFIMDMQAKSAFQMMLATFSADVTLDPNALSRAQELLNHVKKNLTVENFMANPEADNPADRYQAQAKYDTIVGARAVEMDEQGRSTLVPTFMALAAVNEQFRSILAQMPLPEFVREPNNTLDGILTNAASAAMDRLDITMAGERLNSTSVRETMDALTAKIGSIAQDRGSYIDNAIAPVGNAIDAANNWMVGAMTALSRAVNAKADAVKANTTNAKITHAANFAKLLASVFDADVAGLNSRSLISVVNKSDVWQPIHDLLNELVGRTEENAAVTDMIKQVKSVIQTARQQYREHLPELIQKQFSREITYTEQTAMFKGLAKTDIASLRSNYTVSQIKELLVDPAKRATEARNIERRLSKIGHGQIMLRKSKDLAQFLVNGKVAPNLLRNAHAIAHAFNEGAMVKSQDSAVVNDVDHLVSLYALEGLNQTDRDTLTALVQDQSEGVSFVLSYLEGQRKDELVGTTKDPALLANHYKGYIPSEQKGGIGLIVADDAEYLELRKRGYERVADYVGSDAEYGKSKKGYYYSPISGKSQYAQGIIQTVHTTVGGVNAATGFTVGEMTAGRITDPKMVEKITKLAGRLKSGNEQLMPVFDGTGKVIAYERSVDPAQLERLGKNTNISEMLGAWRGRQAEEALADTYNRTLIDRLADVWNGPEQNARKDEFVNLFDKRELAKDPVLADAVRLIPYDTLDYVREKFGDGKFMVRKDMLNDAIGYRQASVGDAWTGTTRWSPEVLKGVQTVATAAFGADAYKRMVQAEKFIQNRVTDARVMIVVKSIVVPLTNLMANVYQLSARGVPIAQTVRSMPKKTAEINAYVKGRLRKIELEGLLRAAGSDVVAQRKHSTEIQSIEDNWKRLSIWPLIQAGEFASVSDVGLGKEDIDITEGRLSAYVEKLVDRMPAGIQTAAKYAIVSKDTALFKGLQKTVEYGDFLAKAVLYDYLTQTKGESSESALGKVTEEYVNYDRLPGRTRAYLDNIGMLWFWNFKVRSAKVAVSMIRNNPVHAMLSMLAPAPPFIGSVGNPITDNILAVAADGRLDNSMGPGQGFRSMELIPWLNLTR